MRRKHGKTILFFLLVFILADNLYVRLNPVVFVSRFEKHLSQYAKQADGFFYTLATAPIQFKYLYFYGLQYVDARNGTDGCSFSLHNLRNALLIERIDVEYYEADSEKEPLYASIPFIDIPSDGLYIDDVGIFDAGYISIDKYGENWLIIRSYIPM